MPEIASGRCEDAGWPAPHEPKGRADARRQTVHRRGLAHIGELAGLRCVEVVRDNDVEGRHGAGIHDSQEVFQLRAGNGSAAPDDGDLLRDRKLLAGTHHDDCRLWIRGIVTAVG